MSAGCTVLAQQSAYQDADSHTSIYLLDGNANLTYNVSSSQFTVGLLRMPSGQLPEFSWKNRGIAGINFSGKPSTSLSNQIFQSGNSPASISGGGVIGFHRWAAPPKSTGTFADDWFLVNVNYTRSTFSTLTSSSTTATAQHFNGFTIMPTYNFALQPNGVTMLIGASAGVSKTNNSDQLKKVSINTTDSQSGSVSVVESSDAYMGNYAESYNVPVYFDFVIIPTKLEWISLDAFERANTLKTDGYTEAGFGIFVAQPNKPTKVLGGISLAWKDGKQSIGIVGGWAF